MLMQRVRKRLVYEYIPVMERTYRSETRESCVGKRSINVILRGNEETRLYMSQVRRNSNSEGIYVYIFKKAHNYILLTFLYFLRPF
jgi:hypothetical protein